MVICMIILHDVAFALLNDDYVNCKFQWLDHKSGQMINNTNLIIVQLHEGV